MVFTRYPRAGETKTRLIPALGAGGAADLHRRMAAHTLRQAQALEQERGVQVEIRYTSGTRREMRSWLGPAVRLRSQGGGDLGVRLERAFRAAFDEGCACAVAVGTDCPGIRPAVIEQALATLRSAAVVMGPARDGGYYLIGMSRMLPGVFEAIPWGTGAVAAVTRGRMRDLGVELAELVELADVDVPDDLAAWEAFGTERERLHGGR